MYVNHCQENALICFNRTRFFSSKQALRIAISRNQILKLKEIIFGAKLWNDNKLENDDSYED